MIVFRCAVISADDAARGIAARVKLVHALVELSSRVVRAEQKCDFINTPGHRAGVAFGMSTGGVAGSRGRRDHSSRSSWQPVQPLTWGVPGVALAAWAGPDGSSLVLYRTLPAPGGTAAHDCRRIG